MAAKNIGQLLHALAQFEEYDRLKGDSIPALQKTEERQREAYGTAGIQQLVIICRASGRTFGHDWLAEQCARLIEDRGLNRTKVDAMTAADIAPHLRKLRIGKAATEPKSPGAPRKDSTDLVLRAWKEGYKTGPQILEQVPGVGGRTRKHQLNNIQRILIRNGCKGAPKSVTQPKAKKSRQANSKPAKATAQRGK